MGEIRFPVGDATVVIPATLEAPAPDAADMTFSGDVTWVDGFTVPAGEVWEFDPEVSTTVRVRGNVVVEGTLRMRPAQPWVTHHLSFEGVNEAAFVGNTHDRIEPTDVGLWIVNDGEVDAVGSPKTAWTRAGGALASGQPFVSVVGTTSGWRVGDTIAITPTASPETVFDFYWRFSERAIAEVVSSNSVRLNGNLQNAHPATHGPAEVLNLTRNVRITGTPSGRAHIMFMHAHKPVHWENVELQWLGPTGKLGRYPLHLHLMGEGSVGSVFSGVVAHDVGNHAFVPHTSHGVTFQACVAHNVAEDAFWWDDGTILTSDALWDSCVASKVDGGYRIGGFTLGPAGVGRRNTIRGCVAAGIAGKGGEDTGPGNDGNDGAGYVWPEQDEGDADWIWTYHDNVAHNCKHNGLFTWQNDSVRHVVEDTYIFNCTSGINHGAYFNRYLYRRITMRNCRRGIWLHAASTTAPPNGLAFEDMDIQVFGYHAVNLNSVTAGAPDDPVIFRRCRLLGYTRSAIRSWGDGGGPADDEWPGLWDFHDTTFGNETLPHVVIETGAPTGTRVREYVGGALVATHQR